MFSEAFTSNTVGGKRSAKVIIYLWLLCLQERSSQLTISVSILRDALKSIWLHFVQNIAKNDVVPSIQILLENQDEPIV